MKKVTWLAILFGLAAFLAQSVPAKDKGDQAVFQKLIDEYWATWSAGNLEKAAAFYDQSADAVYYDLGALKFSGWGEYREGVKHLFEEASKVELGANNDLRTTRHGNIAWTTETFHLDETLKTGKKVELQGRHTAIWEKRGPKWIIVHEHVSIPTS